MICRNCGNNIENRTICPYCGFNNYTQPVQNNDNKPSKGGGNRTAIIIVIIVLIVAIAVFVFVSMKGI